MGKWPVDWRSRLAVMENSVWAVPQSHNSGDDTHMLSPGSSEDDNQGTRTSPKKIMHKKKQKRSGTVPSKQGEEAWKSTMESSMQGLGNSLKLMNQTLLSLTAAGKRKKKAKVVPVKKVQKVATKVTTRKVSAAQGKPPAEVSPTLDLSLGSVLTSVVDYAAQRPLPPAPIPRVENFESVEEEEYLEVDQSVDFSVDDHDQGDTRRSPLRKRK